jgi:hypothetical protein
MQGNAKQRRLPSLAAIGAEVERTEELIGEITKRIDSADCSLKKSMHLQVCRAELRAYWAGLLYALGYTQLLDTQHIRAELNLPKEKPQDLLLRAFDAEGSQYVH